MKVYTNSFNCLMPDGVATLQSGRLKYFRQNVIFLVMCFT